MDQSVLISEARAWTQALGYASRIKKTVGKTPAVKDLRTIYRTQRYRARRGPFGPDKKFDLGARARGNRDYKYNPGRTKTGMAKARKDRTRQERIDGIQQGVQRGAIGRTATRAAYGLLAAGIVGMGVKAVSRFRKNNKVDNPQFRHYDVHPQHQYGVSPVERFNRPVYYDDEEIGAATPRLRESKTRKTRELPKRLTGFQLRRRRFRWTGIKNKMRAFPTHYKRWVKSKVKTPLNKTAKKAVQTPADVARGRQALSRRVSTLPSAPQESTRTELINMIAEACA